MTHLLPLDEQHRSLVFRLMAERQRRARYARLQRRLTPGIDLGDCRVELAPTRNGIAVQVDQAIRVTNPVEAGFVASDLTGCPFVLKNLSTIPELDGEQVDLGIFFGPAEWRAIKGSTLRYEFEWSFKGAESQNVLMLPTNLLRSGHTSWNPAARTSTPAPAHSVVIDENLQHVRAALVRALDAPVVGAGHVIAGALLADPDAIELDSDGCSVWLSGALAKRTRAHSGFLSSAIVAALRVVRDRLGAECPDIVLICQEDRLFAPGDLMRTVIEVDESTMRYVVAEDFDRLTYRLVYELTGIYWGGACQVVGRGGFEFKAAVCAAVALTWAKEHCGERFQAAMSTYHRTASKSWARSVLAELAGGPALRSAARLALRLTEVVSGRAGNVVLLKATKDFWGLQSSPHTILVNGFGISSP